MKNATLARSKMHERFRKVSAPAPSVAVTAGAWFEPELIEILRRPVDSGTSHEAHRMKEHEIGELFARLTILEAWTLHKRLSNPATTDDLATTFGRLILERRMRLLAFLGDARRRAAITQAKRAA